MGFEAVDLDEKLPSPYLDKYEPQKGRADYMFICSPKKWRTEIHYSEVLGKSFHCFNGLCCKVVPKKTPYTIYLVGQYMDGRNDKSGLVLKFIRAGRQVDEVFRSLAEQFEDPRQLTKIDLKVELDTSKPEQFKNLKITPCMDGKRRAGAEALADLKEQINAFMPNLEASVANIISEDEFIKLCEEKDIDLTEFVDDTPVMKASSTVKKKAKPVEEVEEPEEIEDEVEAETEEEVPFLDNDEEEDAEIEEEPAPKVTKKLAPKKTKAKDIPDLDSEDGFDIDSLL